MSKTDAARDWSVSFAPLRMEMVGASVPFRLSGAADGAAEAFCTKNKLLPFWEVSCIPTMDGDDSLPFTVI